MPCVRLRLASLSLLFLLGACDDSEPALKCQEQEPEAEINCGSDDESCIRDALESGSSVSYSSSYQEGEGQFDSSTTTVVVGAHAWTRHFGVEDLCEGDSLDVVRNEALLDCTTRECIRQAIGDASDSKTCFDTWACDAA